MPILKKTPIRSSFFPNDNPEQEQREYTSSANDEGKIDGKNDDGKNEDGNIILIVSQK